MTMNTALTTEEKTVSLFEQLGGAESVTAAVEALYQRVLSDPLLLPFFDNVDIPTMKAKQVLFLTQALGGRAVYKGPPMKPAHAHMAIEEQHFLRVAEHLVETLKSLNVPTSLIDQVIELVGTLASDIVNTTAPKGQAVENKTLSSQGRGNGMGTQGSGAVMDAPIVGQKDITELNALYEAIGKVQAIIEFNLDGTIITANDNFLQTLGYTLAEIQGQHHRMFAESSYAASPEYAAFWAKLNRGEFDAGQYKRVGKGGKEVWIQASYNPVFDANGTLYKVVKFATDISVFIQQAAEYEARNAAVGNGNAVIDFTPDGVILDANENFLKTLGYTLDEIKGKHHSMFAEPAFAASSEYIAFWDKLKRGEFDAGHYKRIGKGGKEVWIQASYNPIVDDKGKTYKVVKFATDITEAKKVEIRAARVSNMMENAPVNVLFADLDLRIKYANPASIKTLKTIEQHLPCKVEDLVGQNIDIFHKNPSHQRNLLKDPKNLPHRANINVGPEVLDLLVSAIFDDSGNYLGPMVTWEVITERLATEAKMQAANEKEMETGAKLKAGVSEVADISTTLASAAEELTSVSSTMGAAAEETSSQATVVSAAAEEVSKNVQSVATGSEELSASFKEIAKTTTDAAKVASEAVSVAEETNVTVGKLGESSAEIGSIIKVITSIAQQTNLLALNATIEAARAGEAGKGFAVVANEVKELAKETTKATENIGKMIETIQGDTKGAVDAIGHIGGIIKQVNDFMNTIASAVEEQLATTNEMTRNVTQASQGTDEIASNILNVAEAAKGTAEGAVQTQTSAAELSKMAANLQSVVQTLTAMQ